MKKQYYRDCSTNKSVLPYHISVSSDKTSNIPHPLNQRHLNFFSENNSPTFERDRSSITFFSEETKGDISCSRFEEVNYLPVNQTEEDKTVTMGNTNINVDSYKHNKQKSTRIPELTASNKSIHLGNNKKENVEIPPVRACSKAKDQSLPSFSKDLDQKQSDYDYKENEYSKKTKREQQNNSRLNAIPITIPIDSNTLPKYNPMETSKGVVFASDNPYLESLLNTVYLLGHENKNKKSKLNSANNSSISIPDTANNSLVSNPNSANNSLIGKTNSVNNSPVCKSNNFGNIESKRETSNISMDSVLFSNYQLLSLCLHDISNMPIITDSFSKLFLMTNSLCHQISTDIFGQLFIISKNKKLYTEYYGKRIRTSNTGVFNYVFSYNTMYPCITKNDRYIDPLSDLLIPIMFYGKENIDNFRCLYLPLYSKNRVIGLLQLTSVKDFILQFKAQDYLIYSQLIQSIITTYWKLKEKK